jgi:hypothetical protein
MPIVIVRACWLMKIIVNADVQECHRERLCGVDGPGKGFREAENFSFPYGALFWEMVFRAWAKVKYPSITLPPRKGASHFD